MIKLVIFDMDGVLYDSEPYQDRARIALGKKYGVQENLEEMAGLSHVEIWETLIRKYGLSCTQPEVEREQALDVLKQIAEDQLPLTPGVVQLMRWLQVRGIALAVASSSGQFLVESVLRHYGISEYFSCVVSGNQVKKRKPAPDIYEKVLETMCVSPAQALAIEDSDTGAAAAAAAGIRCIGFCNPHSGKHALQPCIGRLSSMREILVFLHKLIGAEIVEPE